MGQEVAPSAEPRSSLPVGPYGRRLPLTTLCRRRWRSALRSRPTRRAVTGFSALGPRLQADALSASASPPRTRGSAPVDSGVRLQRRPLGGRPRGAAERIAQKLTDFCDENSLQHFDLARFLDPRTIPFEGEAR